MTKVRKRRVGTKKGVQKELRKQREEVFLDGENKGKRLAMVADGVVAGVGQVKLAKRFRVSRQYMGQLVHGKDIVPFIEKAQMALLESLPQAVENTKALVDEMVELDKGDFRGRQLSFDASKLVMQAGGIVPASAQTTVVTNILNQASIVPSPQVLEILRAHGREMDNFVDVKELEGGDESAR